MSMSMNVQSPQDSSSGLPQWMQARDKIAGEIFDSEDTQKARMVWEMLQKAKRFREHWAKHWDRFWMLWESEQWRRQRPQSLHQAVVNAVFSTVETFVAHIGDDIPAVRAKARHYKHKETAELATKVSHYIDEVNDFTSKSVHTDRDAAICGVGVWRCDWDVTAERGRGGVVYRPVDARYIFVSPFARTLEDASYIVEAKNVPREAVQRWERGALVPPGVWDGQLTNIRVTGGVDRLWDTAAAFTTTDGSQTQQTFASGQNNKTQKDLVTLIEAWIKQEDGTIRYIVVANGIVLQDGPSPYDDEEFPYAIYNLIPTQDGIYGRSIIQFIEKLQDELNQAHSYGLDEQEFSSNSPLIVDIENVEEGSLITNEPGAVFINQSQRGPGYYSLQMPGANGKWLEIEERARQLMDEVLGRVDVLKGEKPAGVDTLGGMEIIQQEANVRLSKMVDHVKAAKRRLTLLSLNRVKQFMKDERVFRISGKGGDEYVEVNKLVGYDMGGEEKRVNTIPEDAEYDVDFVHTAPGGRQAEVELALALAGTPAEDGMPMVDRQFVLEKALEDSVEVAEVLARMQEKAAAQQQQAMAAQQAQSGQPQAEQEMTPEEMSNLALSVLNGQLDAA